MLTGQNGILNRAVEAKEKTGLAQKDEDEKIQGYESTIEQYTGKIPDGLKVGEKVTYSPSGTYNWQAKYCSTTQTDDVTLSSANEGDFNLTEWKVLSIENGKVELVPTKPTDGTVYLGEAQGYNNGVKLLNDACSSLYSNKSKGIMARSLNIEDIEKYMLEAKVKEVHEYQYIKGGGAKYGERLTSAYTSNKNYSTIYAKENLSVINEENAKKDGLSMSQQKDFIEKTDDGATDGKITSATSIHPYQTYWDKNNEFMQMAFKTAQYGKNYYDLLIPEGISTNCWLASRCIATYSNQCNFSIRAIYSGDVTGCAMCNSGEGLNSDSRALFPVVSLNASLISGDSTNGFTVNMN